MAFILCIGGGRIDTGGGNNGGGSNEPTLLRDRLIIPDLHNTGAKGTLTDFDPAVHSQGLRFYIPDSNEITMNFQSSRNDNFVSDLANDSTITFRDINFAKYKLWNIANAGAYLEGGPSYRGHLTFIFENCMFPEFQFSYDFPDADCVKFIYRNCTMVAACGGNSTFENCLMGYRTYFNSIGLYSNQDGIKPGKHSFYNNCYIMDIEEPRETQEGSHLDGLQAYNVGEDVHLYNCRFECFHMPYPASNGGWSYCVYYQGVINNASMDYCTLHGGGQYQCSVNKLGEGTTATNNFISRDYRVACYPNADLFQMTDEGFAEYIDTLLVSSVWEENNYINLMVSNTEHSAKTLRVVTDGGTEYTFNLPACPTFNSEDRSTITQWSDLPLDRTFQIPATGVHKIECYEGDTLLRTYTTEGSAVSYSKGFRDITVIPDKYNTGCDESLITATVTAEDRSALPFDMRSDGVVGWRYMNSKVAEGTHFVVENTQFDLTFKPADTDYAKDVVITFNNCKFKAVALGWYPQKLTCYFNNCSMTSISGGDFVLNNCYIGSKSKDDGMQIAGNVTINGCYVADLNKPNDTGDYTGALGHVDGIQFRSQTSNGGTPSNGGNVHITNTRFELPTLMIPSGYANGYLNACIFTEYQAEIRDFDIRDCYFNGGGYTLYLPLTDTYDVEMTIADSYIGHNRRYGRIYKYSEYYNGGVNSEHVNPKLTIDNIVDTPALYVSSVWKSEGVIHCIVTNDTGEDRTLVIRTAEGDTTYTIPKCLSYNELAALPDNGGYEIRFEDMPFDLDKTVTSNSNYVVCFDNTDGNMTQIRYETFE